MKASGPLKDLCGFSESDKEKDVTEVVLRILKKWPNRTEFPILTVGRTLGREHVLCVELKKPTEMPILRVFEVPGPEDPIPLVVSIVYLARLLPDILTDLIFNEAEYGRTRFPTELSSKENAVKFFSNARMDD